VADAAALARIRDKRADDLWCAFCILFQNELGCNAACWLLQVKEDVAWTHPAITSSLDAEHEFPSFGEDEFPSTQAAIEPHHPHDSSTMQFAQEGLAPQGIFWQCMKSYTAH